MRNRFPAFLAVLAIAASASCKSDSPGPQDPSALPISRVKSAAGECGDYTPNLTYHGFSVLWPCNQTIKVSTSGAQGSALWTAAQEWNSAFPSGYNLPKFEVGTSPHPSVTGTGASSGTVRGVVNNLGSTTTAQVINLASGSGAGHGSVAAILLHEFSHIVGYLDVWEAGGGQGTTGVSDHCARRPNGPGSTYVVTSICQHEIDLVLYAYGVVPTAPDLSKHIVTALVGLPSTTTTLTVGSNTNVTISQFTLGRVNNAVCGEFVCQVSPPSGSTTWSSSSGAVTISGSGETRTLTANSAGTAKITVGVSNSLYQAGALMVDTFMVNVVTQPNLVPYDVSSSLNYVAAGATTTITLTEQNTGGASASGGWWNRLYLSTDNTCCTSDVLLDSTNQTGTIPGGGYGFTNKSVTIPGGTTPGTYYLGGFLDSRSTFTESNENDNKGVGLNTIVVLQCAWPETIVVPVGQSVTVTPTGTCTGRWGVITPANGTLGFGTGSPCSSTSALVKLIGLKFYRCSAGTNMLTVYTDYTLSVVEQVITVEDAY